MGNQVRRRELDSLLFEDLPLAVFHPLQDAQRHQSALDLFYDSLLPHVAVRGDMDRLSTSGYAVGYIGGGVLLLINLSWYSYPHLFGMPGRTFALKASFLSVAVWWLAFSLPLFRHVGEPPVRRSSRCART